MGQRSIIDFCIVSADLFSSVVDVRVKRGAELPTHHHHVVCIPRDLNHTRTRKRIRARRACRIKWELLAKKRVRHTFASKVAFLFRELPDYTEDVETECDLFKSSAAANCGCKCMGGQIGSEKRNAWWNQEVKEVIRAKKTEFRAWLTNKLLEQIQLRYSAARKTAARLSNSLNQGCPTFFEVLGQTSYRAEVGGPQKAVCAKSCSDFLSFVPKFRCSLLISARNVLY